MNGADDTSYVDVEMIQIQIPLKVIKSIASTYGYYIGRTAHSLEDHKQVSTLSQAIAAGKRFYVREEVPRRVEFPAEAKEPDGR